MKQIYYGHDAQNDCFTSSISWDMRLKRMTDIYLVENVLEPEYI